MNSKNSLTLLAISFALLLTYVACSSLLLDSRCEYNHASFVPGNFTHWTQYREIACTSQKTQGDCQSKGFCW